MLASQFESFLEPFLIMLSLPLALVGALLAILITGKNLGMPAMIGVVMLMGLVTKNAILLVDLTNQYVREGLSIEDAILKAGPVRLRPILMTTVAMILGMLPSAMGTGEGSEFRSPISIATIGGLMTSTLLTLVVVPVSYLLLARVVARVKSWRTSGATQLHPAVRVTGILMILVLVGWFLSAASAFAQTPVRMPAATPDGRRQRPHSLLRSGAGAGDQRQRRPEGGAGESARDPGPGDRGEDELFAGSEPELPLHAGPAVSAHPDSRWHLWTSRANVRGVVHATEHHAARS